MGGDIGDLAARLELATAELAAMPGHKAGTKWEADRIREVEWLHRAIDRMRSARRARAELN